jgi:hypothetical protein
MGACGGPPEWPLIERLRGTAGLCGSAGSVGGVGGAERVGEGVCASRQGAFEG